jgi:hypothetical protein
MIKNFTVSVTSDKIWNLEQLLDFLIANQQGHIRLHINPEAICLENVGLYRWLDKFQFNQVEIFTSNPLERHDYYRINYSKHYNWFEKIETINPLFQNWNQSKIFYCLFGRPTASRLGLAAYLRSHHAQHTHIHFSAMPDLDGLVDFELDKLLEYRTASINEVGNLINQLPILLSSTEKYTRFNGFDYTDPLTQLYQDILIDVLAESHVLGNTFYPTEKTIRPMWLKKSFIIFASKNYLDYLHQMGFRTFADFWSEEYDGYEGRDRFLMILELIDNLAKKSSKELEKMYSSMQYTLDHNYNLLKTQSYNKTIQYID